MTQHQKFWPTIVVLLSALIIPLPAFITALPVNRYTNKLTSNVPNNITANPCLCSFASDLIVSQTFFIYKLGYRRLGYFLDIIHFFIWDYHVVILDLKSLFWIAAFVFDAAAVNPDDIETLLASGFNIFFFAVLSNGPKSLSRYPPDCLISCSWVFDNFILTDDLFGKANIYEDLKLVYW